MIAKVCWTFIMYQVILCTWGMNSSYFHNPVKQVLLPHFIDEESEAWRQTHVGCLASATRLVGGSARSPKPTLLTIWEFSNCNHVRCFYKEMLSCCHQITRRMTVKMEVCVCVCVCVRARSISQLYPTHCDPMDCSPPGSSVK